MKRNIFIAVIIIVIFIVIITTAIVLNTNKKPQLPLLPSLPPAQNEQPQNQIDSSDWKIYRNEEYGFEFKYSSDWYLNEENESSAILMPIKNSKPERIFISVSAFTEKFKQKELKSLGEWLKQMPGIGCDKEILIGLFKWCKVFYGFEGVRQDQYGIEKDGVYYVVDFNIAYGRQQMDYYLSDDELTNELKTLNQILSTFRFTK